MQSFWSVLAVLSIALAPATHATPAVSNVPVTKLPLHTIRMPEGFSISLFTQEPAPGARQLAVSQGNHPDHPNAVIVYVGTVNSNGNVYALVKALDDSAGTAQKVSVQRILTAQIDPNGVAWHNGSLYVAEATQITRYDDADTYVLAGKALPKGTVISRAFPPDQKLHREHYLRFGPDGWLYVNEGAESNLGPCSRWNNVTRCTIMRLKPDGSQLQVFAHGIRNSVGFDFDPATNALWATGNEHNGDPYKNPDARPDDVLLHIPRAGLNFGFPYCHWLGSGDERDRNPGKGSPDLDDNEFPSVILSQKNVTGHLYYCKNTTNAYPISQTLGPHVAPLGMKFYTGSMFPSNYTRSIFAAEHGSGNKKLAIGYRIVNVHVHPDGTSISHKIFAEGWLQSRNPKKFWGRPVDIALLPDGSMIVSDNYAGAIYRIKYHL